LRAVRRALYVGAETTFNLRGQSYMYIRKLCNKVSS